MSARRLKYGSPVELRFWDKVKKSESEEGCWEWTAFKSRGYGTFSWWERGKTMRAHRAAWVITNGEIPSGLYVCHHCDNPICVRPSHLFLGTQKDNMMDCFSKGRGYKPRPSNHRRGEDVNTARFTEEKVFQMRRMKLKGVSPFRISKWLGTNHRTVRLAVNGETWKHVPFPRHERDTIESHQTNQP